MVRRRITTCEIPGCVALCANKQTRCAVHRKRPKFRPAPATETPKQIAAILDRAKRTPTHNAELKDEKVGA